VEFFSGRPGVVKGEVVDRRQSLVVLASALTILVLTGCGVTGNNIPMASDQATTIAETRGGTVSLTDPSWKHKPIPSDEQLRAQASQVPKERRMYWGWDPAKQAPVGWVIVGHEPDVFPVFSNDTNDVLGIGVSQLGLISRDQLIDPNVDLEQLARAKWGADYKKLVENENPPSTDG
jgi:hypothetical protein